jgi:hypothetical protein
VTNRHTEGSHLCEYGLCLLDLSGPEQASRTWRQGAAILTELKDSAELQRKTWRMREACAKAGVPPFDG